MATFAINSVRFSAVKENVSGVLGWERVLAYSCGIGFLVVHHMLFKCLRFVFRTPFL